MNETFNEQAFQEFLNKDTNKPFKISPDKQSYSRGTSYIKAYGNEDFDFLIKFDDYYLSSNLENVKNAKSYSHNESFEAIYFKEINTIVYDSSYDDVLSNKCENIKICHLEDLYNQMFNSINYELENRREYLTEAFKNERELIEEKKKRNKDTALKEHFGIINRQKNIISEYKFKDIRNRKMIYDYLLNQKEFVKSFVDSFIKNPDNLNLIKHNVCDDIAYNEVINEVKNNDYVKKANEIYELLNGDLKEAKKIRLIDKNSKEYQVINRFYDMDIDCVMIGDYSTKLDINEIAVIKYGRKEYKISS